MVRKIPWLVKEEPQKTISQHAAQPSRKRARQPSEERREDASHAPQQSRLAQRGRDDHEPPSSPPDIEPPPEVEYMREGYDADDKYRMVEDEFIATANIYTRHLHAHEYEQHKRRVLARGSGIISRLQRPTDGRTAPSRVNEMEKKARAKSKSIKTAVQDLLPDGSATESDGDDFDQLDKAATDPFAGFPTFEDYGNVDLGAVVGRKPNTLAASGFQRTQQISSKGIAVRYSLIADDKADKPVIDGPSLTRDHIPTLDRPNSFTGSITRPTLTADVTTINDRSAASAFLAKRRAALESKQKINIANGS